MTRKCVSRDVLPAMALWCAWRWESLWISKREGFRAEVIWYKVSDYVVRL